MPIGNSGHGIRGAARLAAGGGGGGGGGGGLEDFDWRNPPTRSTTVQHTSVGGSIQNALDSLSSDTELVLDDGAYTEAFSLPATPSITLSGSGSGTTINLPDGVYAVIEEPSSNITSILSNETPADPINRGETTISLDTPSNFSVGDEVLIEDGDDPVWGVYDGASTTGFGPPTSEWNVVTDVGSSTITVERGVLDNYPDTGDLSVYVVDWDLYDAHITNLDLQGHNMNSKSESNYGIHLNYGRDVWIDDVTGGYFRRGLVGSAGCKNFSVRNCTMNNPHHGDDGNYGFRIHGTHHYRGENLHGETMRHMINAGSGSVVNPSYDVQLYDCSAADCSDVYDAHWPGLDVWFHAGPDTAASNISISRPRGVEVHTRSMDGQNITFDVSGSQTFMFSQKPVGCTIEDMHIDNCGTVCYVRPDSQLVVEDCRMEDVRVTNATGDFFDFRYDGGSTSGCNIDNWMVYNCSYNGSWVDMDLISSLDGYDSNNMSFDVQIDNPGMAPSEYFA